MVAALRRSRHVEKPFCFCAWSITSRPVSASTGTATRSAMRVTAYFTATGHTACRPGRQAGVGGSPGCTRERPGENLAPPSTHAGGFQDVTRRPDGPFLRLVALAAPYSVDRQ